MTATLSSGGGPRSSEAVVAIARRVILVILLLAMSGIVVELLLLEHFEDAWQLIPLILLVLALGVTGWHARVASVSSARALRAVMALCVLSGVLGVFLHYRGNAEFEREQNPRGTRWSVFRDAIMGATPTLAPGAMIQIGLLGLLYGFIAGTAKPDNRRRSSGFG